MKKKKILVISIIVIALLVLGLFLGTGRARTDVYLKDFKVSSDGKIMTLEVGVSSSAGYVRKMKKTSGSMNHYYTFYSTYGINSKIGAKDTFEIELDDNIDEIYFYTGNNGYRLELIKSSDTGEWIKINYSANGTIKLNLIDKDDVVKVGINTGKQNNNYFEYSDTDTIEKIYNIFDDLETEIVSKTYNPENAEEMYMVGFFDDDSENALIKSYVEIYRKDGKYYVEQGYNGIYEVPEEDFDLIKSYVK